MGQIYLLVFKGLNSLEMFRWMNLVLASRPFSGVHKAVHCASCRFDMSLHFIGCSFSLSVVMHVFLLIFLLIYSDFVLYIICTRCFSLLCAQSLKAIACHNLWPTLSWAEWQSGGGQRAWQQSLCHSNKSVLQKIHFMISCRRWGWRLVECLVTSITVLVRGYRWRCAGPCLVPTRNPGAATLQQLNRPDDT